MTTRPTWNSTEISRIKQEIAHRIAEADLKGKKKVSALLDMIESIPLNEKNEALRRFLLVLFILNEHAHGTPLKQKTFNMLVKLAETSLRRFGVSPKKSRVDFLYEDFHLILSQIHLRKGHLLNCGWEQILSMRCDGDPDLKLLGLGSSALRLGHTKLALDFLSQVNSGNLTPKRRQQCLAKKVLALRLQGNFDLAAKEVDKALASEELTPEMRLELKWEALALNVHRGEGLLSLFRAVERNREHHNIAYALEAFLWSRAVSSQEWIKKFPTMKTVLSNTELRVPARSVEGKVIKALEACYQPKYDLDYRLGAIGETLGLRDSLENVQQELLLLGAGLRFLRRTQLESAALLWQSEYESLCRKMSDGATSDLLAMGSD